MDSNLTINPSDKLTEDTVKIEKAKIVARFVNGKIIKGYAYDFYPNKAVFRIVPNIDETSNEGIKIQMKDLKAIFFVKDFSGNSSYNENKEFSAADQSHGRKIEITFKDGEVLVGTTVGYTPDRMGFFIFPADLGSNNLRVFVVTSALKRVRFIK